MNSCTNTFAIRLFLVSVCMAAFFYCLRETPLHAASGDDRLESFKFCLEVEGKLAAFFTSVTGLGSESEVVEHKVTNPDTGETIKQKIPGRLKWLDVTLTRGITSSLDIWEWRQQVIDGQVDDARTDCSIVAYNQGNEEIARWKLINAWPSRIEAPMIPGNPENYMIEQITLVHEGLERTN